MLDFIDRYADLRETPAQFQERCSQIALACFWKATQEAFAEEHAAAAKERNGKHERVAVGR